MLLLHFTHQNLHASCCEQAEHRVSRANNWILPLIQKTHSSHAEDITKLQQDMLSFLQEKIPTETEQKQFIENTITMLQNSLLIGLDSMMNVINEFFLVPQKERPGVISLISTLLSLKTDTEVSLMIKTLRERPLAHRVQFFAQTTQLIHAWQKVITPQISLNSHKGCAAVGEIMSAFADVPYNERDSFIRQLSAMLSYVKVGHNSEFPCIISEFSLVPFGQREKFTTQFISLIGAIKGRHYTALNNLVKILNQVEDDKRADFQNQLLAALEASLNTPVDLVMSDLCDKQQFSA